VALVGASLFLFPSLSQARVPNDFFGVAPQSYPTSSDLGSMSNAHVGVVRWLFYWPGIEPSQGSFNWSATDQLVGSLADQGIRTLPYLDSSPGWVANDPEIPPIHSAADKKAWRSFVTAAVRRYGPGGEFWAGRANKRPIKTWQIWNEQNGKKFFQPRPSPRGYGKLVKIAGSAIHHVAPHAKVVLGGMAGTPTRGPTAWRFLKQLYRVNGIKRAFEGVALHPYEPSVSGVRDGFKKIRNVMIHNGDRKGGTYATETGWSSASSSQVGRLGKGLQGQARILRRAVKLLLHHRGSWNVANFDWFAWRDLGSGSNCDWCGTAGLLYENGSAKPSYGAYKSLAG
jgi:hypothetical protein